MANTNCLAGMKCPRCNSEGPFKIAVSIMAMVHDSGVSGGKDRIGRFISIGDRVRVIGPFGITWSIDTVVSIRDHEPVDGLPTKQCIIGLARGDWQFSWNLEVIP